MTLIVALEGKDGLVLAADSRGTIGDPRGLTAISDVHQKVFKLSDYCGIGISGSSELGAKLLDELLPIVQQQQLAYADDVLGTTRATFRSEFNDWFSAFGMDARPVVLLALVGYHKISDEEFIPRLYLLNSRLDFAPQLMTTGILLIGIPQYATYLSHRLYDRNMDLHQVCALAYYLITETATQDPKVGGPVRMAKVTPSEGYQELQEGEISTIAQCNSQRIQSWKEVWLEKGGGNG